jgi:hypothetical protein
MTSVKRIASLIETASRIALGAFLVGAAVGTLNPIDAVSRICLVVHVVTGLSI